MTLEAKVNATVGIPMARSVMSFSGINPYLPRPANDHISYIGQSGEYVKGAGLPVYSGAQEKAQNTVYASNDNHKPQYGQDLGAKFSYVISKVVAYDAMKRVNNRANGAESDADLMAKSNIVYLLIPSNSNSPVDSSAKGSPKSRLASVIDYLAGRFGEKYDAVKALLTSIKRYSPKERYGEVGYKDPQKAYLIVGNRANDKKVDKVDQEIALPPKNDKSSVLGNLVQKYEHAIKEVKSLYTIIVDDSNFKITRSIIPLESIKDAKNQPRSEPSVADRSSLSLVQGRDGEGNYSLVANGNALPNAYMRKEIHLGGKTFSIQDQEKMQK